MEVTVLDNVEVMLLIISAIFLLIALLGGGFEVSAIRVPRATAPARIFAGILGIFLLAQVVPFPAPTPRDPHVRGTPEAPGERETPVAALPPNTIPITIAYAPEEAPYLLPAIAQFNESYQQGTDPITESPLTEDEQRIFVIGQEYSSGTAH